MHNATEKPSPIQLIKQLLSTNDADQHFYKVRYTLSYYDHWLSEHEAEQAFALNSFDDYPWIQQIEARVLKMFIDLYHRFKMMYYDTKLKKLEAVADNNELIVSVLGGLRESGEFIYYIDNIDALLVSNYDQTVTFYGLDNVDLADFEEIIKSYHCIF